MYPRFFPTFVVAYMVYKYVTTASPSYLMQQPDEEFKNRVRRGGVEKHLLQQIQKDLAKDKDVPATTDDGYVRQICNRFVDDKCQYYFSKNFEELIAAAREDRRPNCDL